MTFSMKGRFTSRPGWRMTRRGCPNCSTKAIWVWSTMNSELIMNMPAITSATAAAVRVRRFTTLSSLPAAQGRHGGGRRWHSAAACRRRPGTASRRIAGTRRARLSLAVPQGRQRQIRQHPAAAFRGSVDDHLVAVFEDLLHRLKVEPLQRDILRRLEGFVDRGETIGVTLGARDGLLAIGLGFLLDARGIAPRARNDVVA